jgi:hypothetical protein
VLVVGSANDHRVDLVMELIEQATIIREKGRLRKSSALLSRPFLIYIT